MTDSTLQWWRHEVDSLLRAAAFVRERRLRGIDSLC